MEVTFTIGIHNEVLINCSKSLIPFLRDKTQLCQKRSPQQRVEFLEKELKEAFPGVEITKKPTPEKLLGKTSW